MSSRPDPEEDEAANSITNGARKKEKNKKEEKIFSRTFEENHREENGFSNRQKSPTFNPPLTRGQS
jgi:hypothetical protein